MGKGIKTRVAEKGIKAIDKAAVASERMKEAYIRTRDKADHSLYAEESSPGEYASDRLSSGVDHVTHEAIHQFDKQGRKGIKTTKENISKVKENIQKRKAAAAQPKKEAEKRAARQASQRAGHQAADRISEPVRTLRQERGAVKTLDRGKKGIKTVDRGRKTVKQASSTAKGTIKTASKSIKTAEKTAKASIKTTQQAAKAAQRTAQATASAARAAAHAARAAARAAGVAAKVAAKATIAAAKAIIAATKALIAAIAAGGWIAVLVIVIICLIGLLIGSCFGIFFSGEDSGSGYTMQNVVQEINDDYQQQIDTTKANLSHDVLEMSGSRAVWPEVLAVYAVKTTTDPDNPVLNLAAAQDYDAFFEQEIAYRKLGLYPPFCGLCVVGFSGPKEIEVARAAARFAALLGRQAAQQPDLPLRVLGPTPGNIEKINENYRYKLTIKCRADRRFRDLVRQTLGLYEQEKLPAKATVAVDMHSDGDI